MGGVTKVTSPIFVMGTEQKTSLNMPNYYKKELFASYFYVKGKAVPFEPLDGNSGVGKFDPATDSEIVAALDKAAAGHKGGVVKITEAEYEALKKNKPLNPSAGRRKVERLKPWRANQNPFAQAKPRAAVAEAAKGDKPAPQTPKFPRAADFKPATSRRSHFTPPNPA
jgi:hypothetical protein